MPQGTPEIDRTLALLSEADAVMIAASNGFDIADGYNQFACDEEFLRRFGDFHQAYGLSSMLQGLMAHWGSEEVRWAFLSRLIDYGYASYEPSAVMRALERITRDIPRFVVTCNCNGRFERAGFDPRAIFETEGSYARLRCSASCCDTDYDASPVARRILERAHGLAVDPDILPRCPHCGASLDVAVDDTGALATTWRYQEQLAGLRSFLERVRERRVLVLDLGVGQCNQAIKAPLMRHAGQAPGAAYVVLNRDEAVLPFGMGERAVALAGDLGQTLVALADGLADARARVGCGYLGVVGHE